ncbi:Mpv17-like protein 2 [Trichoplax sp. H2]|nr:Mpv17-like protein 2 [Trichoplax sp. H2]|eukprot:RDD40226.1 Mpv17-like protein 2 [Trichoplax sp. H2]
MSTRISKVWLPRKLKAILSTFWSRNLMLANVISAGALCGLGDIIQQNLEGSEKHDWKRTGRMATVGLLVGLPTHYFYTFLDQKLVGTAATTIGKKVVLDEALMAPISISTFYLGMGMLEGQNWDDSKDEWQRKFWPTYKVDVIVWPIGQAINFKFIPGTWRVLYVNVLTLFYDIFLSYMKHKVVFTNNILDVFYNYNL